MFSKENQKKNTNTKTNIAKASLDMSFADLFFFLRVPYSGYILPQVFPAILRNLSAQCGNYVEYGTYFISSL